MTVTTWITMGVILLVVWGGFGLALSIAIRREASKQTPVESSDRIE